MTVLTEIDSLIEVIAAKLPGSMENPENKRLEAAFKKSMSNYFSSLAEKFPFDKLTELYQQKVKEE